jgi:hypothetical protein
MPRRSLTVAQGVFIAVVTAPITSAALAVDSPYGTWERPCVFDQAVGLDMTETMVIAAGAPAAPGTVTLERQYYPSAACATPDFMIHTAGRMRIGTTVAPTTGAREADVTWSTVTVKPLSAESAQSFNTLQVCGLQGWAAGVARDVAGRACGSFQAPAVGSTLYQLFAVRGNQLERGDTSDPSHDGSSDARRPTTFEETPFARHGD